MRYSEIIGKGFYNIRIPVHLNVSLDIHFTASAHHYLMLKQALTSEQRAFHKKFHFWHLVTMVGIIYEHGDFTNAEDKSLRGLDLKESWNPRNLVSLPDPAMFNSMDVDPSCRAGEHHPSDWYLGVETNLFKTTVPICH